MSNNVSTDVKSKYVYDFVNKVISQLQSNGLSVGDEQRRTILAMYMNSPKSIEDIQDEIISMAQQFVYQESIARQQQNNLAKVDQKRRILTNKYVSSGAANAFLLSLITGFVMGLVSVVAYMFISQ